MRPRFAGKAGGAAEAAATLIAFARKASARISGLPRSSTQPHWQAQRVREFDGGGGAGIALTAVWTSSSAYLSAETRTVRARPAGAATAADCLSESAIVMREGFLCFQRNTQGKSECDWGSLQSISCACDGVCFAAGDAAHKRSLHAHCAL